MIGKKIANKIIEIHGSKDFEIAFLPYKRSMWNSMSSVYYELKDLGVKVHCMPIPYLRLKANKEVDYIDTDFSLFGDIAKPIEMLDKPDYIAIHYQYENNNKVTGMLPEYFTKALKYRYGAKIIYLPYGIGMGLGHFALQPGCRDIDYAFLESEDMAERFIAGWKLKGVDFEGRVFGYGSAKMDAVVGLKREIPDEWKPIIRDRRVLLITTSLGAFLTNPRERMMYYMQNVGGNLKQNAIIFRPHPLMRQTIKSMVNYCLYDYERMLNDFRSAGVIVDESEYLERAIAASDYLISDPSSVVEMWKVTGKPYTII